MDSPPLEGTIVKSRTETVKTEDDGSVITTTKTVYVTSIPSYTDSETTVGTLKKLSEREEDYLVPVANRRSIINREAYLKLHSLSGTNTIDNLKVKYEGDSTNAAVGLSEDTIETLKEKYSPSSFGYPKIETSPESPKSPPPVVPRTTSLRVKPNVPEKPEFLRYSYIPYVQKKPDIPKRSSLLLAKAPRLSKETPNRIPIDVPQKIPPVPRLTESTLSKLEDPNVEERVIIRRSSSEDSVGKIESELSEFTMDTKQKKRTSSFKKILTGGIFGKDKKKSEKKNEEKQKTKKTDNVIVSDNAQNEQTFKVERQNSVKRTPISQNDIEEMEKRYAEMHINQFNRIKANFANQDVHNENQYRSQQQYNRKMQDKYLESSSSTNTLESEGTSSKQGTYQNALIAQAEMMHLRELELKALNETPPRAKETHQNVQLVKPKALIPISSERALPNPYQNDENLDNNLNRLEKDFDQSSYSPNVTKSSNSSNLNSPSSPGSYSTRSSPKSPTLEGSKLKLPQNREKVNLQPRIKSPIPQNKISTDKIIATELLKKSENKRTGPSHQNLEIEIDYPDQYDFVKSGYKVTSSSPNQSLEAGKWHQKQRELEKTPSLLGLDAKLIAADVHKENHNYNTIDRSGDVSLAQPQTAPDNIRKQDFNNHVNINQINTNQINTGQLNINQNNRSVTPVRRAPSNASLQYSPSKQEMRQSVEIYCWKEIQKLKEKQDQELKYQLQYTPHGCVEDPIIHRRSRSVEPSQSRGRRSTSLPREAKPSQIERTNRYNQLVIPENRPVYYANDNHQQNHQLQQNFIRSSPQRRTVSGTERRGYDGYYSNAEVPYRPIFNRGTLNPNIPAEQYVLTNQINQQKKNVSFNGNYQQNQGPWPTKNGYVESPPQRRLFDKSMSIGSDDVFVNNNLQNQTDSMNQNVAIRREPIYGTKPVSEVDGRIRSVPQEQAYVPRRQIQEESYVIRRQIIEDPYGQRQIKPHQNSPLYALQENKHNLNEASRQRQENISQNQIYGMQQTNHPVYSSKLSIQESPYGTRESVYGSKSGIRQNVNESYGYRINEPLYGPKQVTISNKYCDIYGRIHDNGQRTPLSPPYGQQQGIIYGQLQGNVLSRPPMHHSHNQLPNNFVRGSRLTSSANDMYRRDPRIAQGFNPNAPLPPIPMENKSQILMRRRGPISDTESERNFGK